MLARHQTVQLAWPALTVQTMYPILTNKQSQPDQQVLQWLSSLHDRRHDTFHGILKEDYTSRHCNYNSVKYS